MAFSKIETIRCVRAVASAAASLERTEMTTWDVEDVPREFAQVRAGHRVVGYPALVDEGGSVGLRVFAHASAQATAMRAGVRRLACLAVESPAPRVVAELDNEARLALGLNPHGSTAALLADCWAGAVDSLLVDFGGPPWDRSGFERLVAMVAERGLDRTVNGGHATAAEAVDHAVAVVDQRVVLQPHRKSSCITCFATGPATGPPKPVDCSIVTAIA